MEDLMKPAFRLTITGLALSLSATAPIFAQSNADSEDSGFTMALTGDAIITRKLSAYDEPWFLALIELMRDADVAFTNLEVLFHDYESYPAHESGGTWMRADPALAKELAWAGVDLVSRANNHSGDYSVHGLRLTTRYVDEAGLVQAGVGESLAEAREAKFLEVAGSRVALVSAASTFPGHARAGKSRGDIPARPGLSPLRHTTTRITTADQLLRLQKLLRELQVTARGDSSRLRALGTTFVVGDAPGVRTAPNPDDLAEISAVVSNASRLSDYTIVSLHGHESAGNQNSVPAEFIVTFARAMIDAGADVVVGHGPHVLRGIEIYRGKPIFYSLGDFIFQNETLDRLPYENYEPYELGPDSHVADFNDARYDLDRRSFPANREIWEAVVAAPRWQGEELVELVLHPISLGFGQPRWVRGRPMLATGELAEKIIEDIRVRSERFGTEIEFRNGVGRVKLK
jgi:poly-gamma-glutamate capsule biosynthesis protein CapA/YwtB (metallophosphatase superfamily)